MVITEVADRIEETYKNVVSCILKRSYVIKTPASHIDILDRSNYLSFIDFELGDGLKFMAIEHGASMEEFYKNAFNFIFSVCMEMKTRYKNFSNDVLLAFKSIHPPNVLSKDFHASNSHLFDHFLHIFGHLIEDKYEPKIRKQWESLQDEVVDPAAVMLIKTDDFWYDVFHMKDKHGNSLHTEDE